MHYQWPLTSHLAKVLVAATAALVALPLVWHLPNNSNQQWIKDAQDFGHMPLFFVIQLLLLVSLRLWQRAPLTLRQGLAAVGLSAVLGAGIEFVQTFIGRSASWEDFGRDCLGIGAGYAVYLGLGARTRPLVCAGYLLLSASLFVIAALPMALFINAKRVTNAEFPRLMDFDHKAVLQLVSGTRGGVTSFTHKPSSWAKNNGAVMRLQLPPNKKLPGFSLTSPPSDWSGYTTLMFEAYVEPTDAIAPDAKSDLYDPLQDVKFGINFYSKVKGEKSLEVKVVNLQPGNNTIALTLPVSAKFNPKRITSVSWHALNIDRPRTVYFDNIRLSKNTSAH